MVEEEIGEGGSCRLGENGGGARGGEAWQGRGAGGGEGAGGMRSKRQRRGGGVGRGWKREWEDEK